MSTDPTESPDLEARPAPPGFEMIQGLGYSLIFALMGLSIAIPQTGFLEMFKSDIRQMNVESFLQISVLIALLVLSVRWIGATRKEAHLWLTWTSMKQEPAEAFGAIIGIAFYLGLSVGFVGRPVLLTGYFMLGTAFSIWTQWYCCRQFARAGPREDKLGIPPSMTHYWVRRPHCLRIVLVTLFAVIAFGFALTGWLWPHGHSEGYILVAYCILFVDVAVAETQISFWRQDRDEGINLHVAGQKVDPCTGSYTSYCLHECRLQAVLALLPIFSFLGQLYFSLGAGTFKIMLHHGAVMYADWLLVPFNFYAVRAINWSRGITLYVITIISTILVLLAHAAWVIQGVDPGHMISRSGVILAAGWVHIGFSICEMVILVAFVFCRRGGVTVMAATIFGCAYFAVLGIGGFVMHGHLILSDAVVLISGLIFMLILPAWKTLRQAHVTKQTATK